MVYSSKCVVHQNRKSPVFVEEFSFPSELNANEVVVKTEYSSINPVDVKVHALTLRNSTFHTLKDFSGTVVAAGSSAQETWKVGEKVFGVVKRPSERSFVGSYTLVDINATGCLGKLPPSLSFAEGAAIPIVYGTAYEMLKFADNLKPLNASSKVLVLGGATSVGTFAIELAKKVYGVEDVVATCSPSSAEYVASFGARTLSYKVPDLSAELQNFVKKEGFKFDTIVDCVGGYDALRVTNDILKPSTEGSSYSTVMGDTGPSGTYGQTVVNALKSLPFMIFRALFGKYYGINYLVEMLKPGPWLTDATTIFAIPGMKVPIDSTYPLEDVKTAWNKVDSTRARGKVLIKF